MGRNLPHSDSSPDHVSTAIAAVLAWILPGLGHWWIGQRARGVILCIVTSITFWAGVAVGGVRTTVAPTENGAWIAAQLCIGPQALVALAWGNQYRQRPDEKAFRAPWPASNISVVYAGIAGLLNLLIILDVVARSETGDAPTAEPARAPPAAEKGIGA